MKEYYTNLYNTVFLWKIFIDALIFFFGVDKFLQNVLGYLKLL